MQLLGVAEEMLEGEIAYRRGEHDAAFARLRAAIALEDDLPYDEPWGWMQPIRHALGALHSRKLSGPSAADPRAIGV